MSQIPNPYSGPTPGAPYLVGVPPQHQPPTTEQLEKRYLYHPPKNDQGERYEDIRNKICTLAKQLVRMTPCSPEQSRMLNCLDEAMFLANAAIARNE